MSTGEETKEQKRKRVAETFDTLSQGWAQFIAPAVEAHSQKTIRIMQLFRSVREEAVTVAVLAGLEMNDDDLANDLDARNQRIALKTKELDELLGLNIVERAKRRRVESDAPPKPESQ